MITGKSKEVKKNRLKEAKTLLKVGGDKILFLPAHIEYINRLLTCIYQL